MYISEIRPIDSKKALIIFDEEPSFRLYKGEIRRYKLTADSEISRDIYLEILNKVIKPRCFKRAMYLLSKKDYTVHKLRDKLDNSDYPKDVIDMTVDDLISLKYLDDIRFAENYINFRHGSMSLKNMRQKLMLMGISKDDIEQAIYNLSEYNVDMDSSDMIAAKKDFYKKLKRIKDTDERVVRNKLYSFMASKGYSYKITGELIEEFVNNNNYDKNY